MNINWKVDNVHGKYITAKEALKLGISKQVVLDGIQNKNLEQIRIPELMVINYFALPILK